MLKTVPIKERTGRSADQADLQLGYGCRSTRVPESEIHALSPQHGVVAILQWQYAMVIEACVSASDHDIAMR